MLRTRPLVLMAAGVIALAASSGTASARPDPEARAERECVRAIITDIREGGQKPRLAARDLGFDRLHEFKESLRNTVCSLIEPPPPH